MFFKRSVALLLTVTLLAGYVPSAKSMPEDVIPPGISVEESFGDSQGSNSETVVPEESIPNTEEGGTEIIPSESTAPDATVEPTVVTTETTKPQETTEVVPENSSVPQETKPSVPMEELVPAETQPKDVIPWMELTPAEEIKDGDEKLLLNPGDVLTLWQDPTIEMDEVDGFDYRSPRSISISNTKSYWIDETQFANGKPSYTSNLQYFEMSDGSVGYCLQPGHNDPDKNYPLNPAEWSSSTKEAVARAMAYGAPNNALDWSDAYEWRIATSTVIWDIVTGHRDKNGDLTNGSFQTNGKGPFEAKLKNSYYESYNSGKPLSAGSAGEKYDLIVYRMRLHGTIPSFTSSSEGSIGESSTIKLKKGNDGYYYGSATDATGILSAFSYYDSNPYGSGLSISRNGSTLNFKATEDVAMKIGSRGVVLSSRRSSGSVSPSDLLLWTDNGWSNNLPHQLVVTMPRIDPTPSFFKIVADEPATMTVKKTSNSPNVEGYCFNIFRQAIDGPSRLWQGKSDSNGNVGITDGDYNFTGEGYTFTGLTDGYYAFREVLSKSTHGEDTFPTKWVIRLYGKGATKPHEECVFTGSDIKRREEGDATLLDGYIRLYGINGGGRVEMEIYNELQSSGFTLRKSVNSSNQSVIDSIMDNKCYSLEGAQYDVIQNGVITETMTTDANGVAQSKFKYPYGTKLRIVERVAPKGFLLDSSSHDLTITNGDNVINVSDVPSFDPMVLRFGKIDKVTGKPQGDTSFEGAVFKWEYFDNYNWSGSPKRVWHFKTNSEGKTVYDSMFEASGFTNDELYVDTSGNNSLPLGSLRVSEIVAPDGYGKIVDLYATITQLPDGRAKFMWTPESFEIIRGKDGNYEVEEAEDKTSYGSIELDKVDSVTGKTPQGDGTLEGAVFEVINNSANAVSIEGKVAQPGEVCYEFKTDANGYFKSGKIFPMGTYTVREKNPPVGYTLNSSTININNQGEVVKKETTHSADYGKRASAEGKWVQNDTGWWFQYTDGTYPANKFEYINDTWYYFDERGYMVTGWREVDGETYYFASSGYMVTGWRYIDNYWYYFNTSGHMVTGWELVDGRYFYFDNSGHMLTGWQEIGGETYYLGTSGAMVTGWNYIDSKWYYFNGSGHRVSGTQVIDGENYEFGSDGVLALNMWTKEFSITKDVQEVSFSVNNGDACENAIIYGGIKIIKQDNDLGNATTGEEPLNGIKFTVENASKHPIVVGGKTYNVGDVVATLPISWTGTEWSASINLPYGTYTVKEVEFSPGMANEYYELDTTVHTLEVRDESVTVEAVHKNPIAPGTITVEKVNGEKQPLANAKIALEWSSDNQNWQRVTKSDKIVKGGSTSANLTADGCLVTDGTGKIEFSGLYPTLFYRVVEEDTAEGYVLLTEPVYIGKLNPNDQLSLGIRIVNERAFELPRTGATSMGIIGGISGMFSVMSVATLVVYWKKKREV